MDKLNNIVLLIQHYLADYILIILLLGGGVIFTIRLGFIQIRGFKAGWKRTFGGLFSKKGTAGKDTGRNGEYCRSGNSIGNRRTGSDFLDVDCGISWNGDHFRRSYYGSEI